MHQSIELREVKLELGPRHGVLHFIEAVQDYHEASATIELLEYAKVVAGDAILRS
jgi:hypothetical protein